VTTEESSRTSGRRVPTPVDSLDGLLRSAFGHEAFRPLQAEVCRAVTQGRDVLLVMPTGAGKSLCYQLPGLARAGTTLVISPLIALMEDQVSALQDHGIAAERIHSGRDQLASRAVCRDYLDGNLDFLFIAPERLAVPGFPEMLAKRPPVLIAVDEAHCISHWGHDFRPDYRMLSERLPMLRPAPVIALTATATPLVQRDIVEQLAIPEAKLFIHGFRRTNIAVEVVEAKPSARGAVVRRVLEDAGRRPAIVYSPTRKETEALAAELNGTFPAAAYHAGMTSTARDRAQRAFQDGGVEVIVATIAFGMGIDKPDIRTVIHTGMPGTLEGYYQEIGRAGRDGDPARAILLYSWADRRTHEFFLGRDYPEPSVLAKVYGALSERARPAEELCAELGLDDEVFTTALEKLWIHRGALVDPEENATRGRPDWRVPYEAQLAHRQEQIERMTAFASGRGCRMLHLVRHFGDQHDSGEACETCDQCAPNKCLVNSFRKPEGTEIEVLAAALDLLRERDGLTSGQLHRQAAEGDDPVPTGVADPPGPPCREERRGRRSGGQGGRGATAEAASAGEESCDSSREASGTPRHSGIGALREAAGVAPRGSAAAPDPGLPDPRRPHPGRDLSRPTGRRGRAPRRRGHRPCEGEQLRAQDPCRGRRRIEQRRQAEVRHKPVGGGGA